MWQEYIRGENTDLEQYNNTDVACLRRINEEENILGFMIQVCRETRSFMSQFQKSWLIDSFILYQGHLQGRPLLSKDPFARKEGKFDGALVPGPQAWALRRRERIRLQLAVPQRHPHLEHRHG